MQTILNDVRSYLNTMADCGVIAEPTALLAKIDAAQSEFAIGEIRHTSAGNVFRLEAFDGVNRCTVRRIGILGDDRPTSELWDHDMTYCWSFCQWESIPLLGADTSDYPFFGRFIHQLSA